MNLGRHSISSTNPVQILDAKFDAECEIFAASTPAGFAVYRTNPLQLIRKRELTGGTLAAVLPLHASNILFLLGGGRSPLYPPNKVILWNDALGKEVAELEFRERVRGLACRRGWLAVSLRRRVVVFQVGETVTRYGEWDTCDNPRGLLAMATSPYSTLLAIAGRQIGHVQLIRLPPCSLPVLGAPPSSSPPIKAPHPSSKHPVSIIAAHTSALTTLSIPTSGRLLATTSVRGTLVRIWDATTGKLVKEFRRGTDKAEIYGVAFRPDEQELCVWSDKGTVHVFNLVVSGATNRQSTFSPLTPFLPLPKYFESEWSYAQYRIPVQSSHISISSTSRSSGVDLPEEERCVVGWIQVSSEEAANPSTTSSSPLEYQLIVLTFTGGWYRLSLPKLTGTSNPPPGRHPPSSSSSSSFKPKHASQSKSISGSSATARPDKGKERARGDSDKKESRNCILQEYRRFGRWDGWG
ncbi:WD repeat domain phosphoinositide-interacting protein 3 [Psilocybe cubensis]|uniref:WD repeat domain phosphoinositide-interacting protein 3 n=2 Tax=Psilocybe cubensis TaxID=181762 RepID=A0ACB8H5P6_PSICU|nr:WD repeat domain phosphoinositide-interacting protein 3 [Psilocybe cubensis]KAH9482816.1 WD repeat domain phosphoinositide-interacting protein 3 [Psilocybe cubensis]